MKCYTISRNHNVVLKWVRLNVVSAGRPPCPASALSDRPAFSQKNNDIFQNPRASFSTFQQLPRAPLNVLLLVMLRLCTRCSTCAGKQSTTSASVVASGNAISRHSSPHPVTAAPRSLQVDPSACAFATHTLFQVSALHLQYSRVAQSNSALWRPSGPAAVPAQCARSPAEPAARGPPVRALAKQCVCAVCDILPLANEIQTQNKR